MPFFIEEVAEEGVLEIFAWAVVPGHCLRQASADEETDINRVK